MKKSRILGYALTLATTLFVGSAMGQVRGTNFVELKNQTVGGAQVSITPELSSLVQVKLANGFFAQPSSGYHPGYLSTNTPAWQLTKDFTWAWTATTAVVTPTITFGTPTGTATGLIDDYANFTTIKVDKPGTYVIKVQEKAAASFGSCLGTPTTFNLEAFDAPSFDVTGTPSTDVLCSGLTNQKFSFDIASSGTPQVKYKLEQRKVTINSLTGTKTVGTTAGDLLATDIASNIESFTAKWLENQTAAVPTNAGALNNTNIELKTGIVVATHALATYIFTLKKDLTAPASGVIAYRLTLEGVNGLLSRKADYDPKLGTAPVGDFTFYGKDGAVATTTNTVTYDIFVAAAPNTGPVFHIGNNIAK